MEHCDVSFITNFRLSNGHEANVSSADDCTVIEKLSPEKGAKRADAGGDNDVPHN